MLLTFRELAKETAKYLPQKDINLIKSAFLLAEKCHRGQKRKTGEDYIKHPLRTSYYLAQQRLDSATLATGLLHDTVEDTNFSFNELRQKFGREIAQLADGVTKLGLIKIKKAWIPLIASKKTGRPEFERQIETLRKMILAMSRDIRVILIKLADRRDNMETIIGIEAKKRKRFAEETLEIYAPIAYRLGMGNLKAELEDLSFLWVYPQEYKWLDKFIKNEVSGREKYLKKVEKILSKKLDEYGVRYEISGRIKHLYSLYLKLQRVEGDLSRVYDLIALRVVVDSIAECYQVLGIIHSAWKPLPNHFSDFIAIPKPNGYQSLHTTVWCEQNKIVEFQIRTHQMHEQAEFGIAAHWRYHEAKRAKNPAQKILWLKEEMTLDFFQDRIFVFTPEGDVKDLPLHSTPIDFAYAIHTEIGNRCLGARVNNKIAGLNHELQSGDIVEIIIAKTPQKPKRDWLKLAHTHHAREVIKKRLKEIL